MEIQNLIERLKQCENEPLFRRVLVGDTSFEKEVLSFYDINEMRHRYHGEGRKRGYNFDSYYSSKERTYPNDIVRILNSIVFIPFDKKILEYQYVRDICTKINNPKIKAFYFAGFFATSIEEIKEKNPLDKLYVCALLMDKCMNLYRIKDMGENK